MKKTAYAVSQKNDVPSGTSLKLGVKHTHRQCEYPMFFMKSFLCMLSILISLIHVSDAWIGGGRGISFKVARQRCSCSARQNNIARFATLQSRPTDSFEALEELRSELMLACDEFRDEQKKHLSIH